MEPDLFDESPNPSRTTACVMDAGRKVLNLEAEQISRLADRLDDSFARAVTTILGSSGRVVVCGLGKTGHIGRKIASTLASTGTPAYFVHAAEALHGDLGMITPSDVLIAISHSGEGEELIRILPLVRRMGARLIAMTGSPDSTLAREADIHLDAGVEREACPLNLAPTASTTVALALGDALAVALLEQREFSSDDFARSHPGGSLGRKLLTLVRDIMQPDIPHVSGVCTIPEVLKTMTRGGMGMVVILAERRIEGIFTDGDLRRGIERLGDLRTIRVSELMSARPITIGQNRLAVDALKVMDDCKVSQLVVTDENGLAAGALSMHDLVKAKVI